MPPRPFSDPRNLQSLTPDTLRFEFQSLPDRVDRGSRISYRLRLHGVPMYWETLIAAWEPPHRFIDVQLHGPYALWQHEHIFQVSPDGVSLIDSVTYALPFAPFSNVALPFVQRDIDQIFAFRREKIQARFSK